MPYKILSLDGGGSWALLEALALGKLHGPDTSGRTLLNRFDLVAANSGGSIILAGLALDLTPRQIISLLNDQTKRNLIFVKNFFHLPTLERYKAAAKLPGLRTILGPGGDQPLNTLGLNCKLLIATFDYDRLRAQFFRSDPNSPAAGASACPLPTLAEAVHASSNAPIKFFDEPAQLATPAFAGSRFWDGAMGGFNNPTMAAVTEALAYGIKPGDMRILSLGTANVFLPMPKPIPAPGSSGQSPLFVPIDKSGLFHDLGLAATTIIDDPPDQASFTAHLVTSGPSALSQDPARPVTNGNLVRLNPWIQPLKTVSGWTVPPLLIHVPSGSNVTDKYSTDAAIFAALTALEIDAIDQIQVDLITTLGNAWLADTVPNQSIRATPDLQSLIGHPTFSAAATQAGILGLSSPPTASTA